MPQDNKKSNHPGKLLRTGERFPQRLHLVDLHSIALKETIFSLEFPFFQTAKRPCTENLRFEHRGSYIEFRPDREFGLPTVFDQDLMIFAVSLLVADKNRLEKNRDAGRLYSTDERTIRFSNADFCEFAGRHRRHSVSRRKLGGSQYVQTEAALRRLTTPTLIFKLKHHGIEQTAFLHLLNESYILRGEALQNHLAKGINLDACQIQIPDWIVSAIKTNDILTLHDNYFDVRGYLARQIYQICRKFCGDRGWMEPFHLSTLHSLSGSRSQPKDFRRQVKNLIKKWMTPTEENPNGTLLDYNIEYLDRYDKVKIAYAPPRWKEIVQENLERISKNPAQFTKIIKDTLPMADAWAVFHDWLDDVKRLRKPLFNPAGHCKDFAKRYRERAEIPTGDTTPDSARPVVKPGMIKSTDPDELQIKNHLKGLYENLDFKE